MLLWSSNYLEWCRLNFNVWVLLGEILPRILPAIIRPHRCQSRSELRSAREANAGEKKEIERRDAKETPEKSSRKSLEISGGMTCIACIASFCKIWTTNYEASLWKDQMPIDDHRWPIEHFWHFCLETMEDLPFYPILNNETLNWRNHAVQLLVLQFLLQIWYKVEKIFKKTGERVDLVDFLFITMRRPRQEDLQDQPQVTEVERQWLDGTVKTPLSRHASEGETWKKVKFTRQRTHMKHTIVSLKLFNCREKWPFWGCHVKSFGTSLFSASNNQFCLQKESLVTCYISPVESWGSSPWFKVRGFPSRAPGSGADRGAGAVILWSFGHLWSLICLLFAWTMGAGRQASKFCLFVWSKMWQEMVTPMDWKREQWFWEKSGMV